ncbi:hypothetical protein DPMN_045556 [Dreissena polymorpha]|uniref:Uncharacterized protein n=1 Tax=Dreissena polymorpha TaxID=45954 RepID=A0A9D4D4K5_DREPO|nr:hypothetical protein DPMN_045556 [Dreissena polymorpha]
MYGDFACDKGVGPEGQDPEGVGPEGKDPEGVGPEGEDPEGVGPEGEDPKDLDQGVEIRRAVAGDKLLNRENKPWQIWQQRQNSMKAVTNHPSLMFDIKRPAQRQHEGFHPRPGPVPDWCVCGQCRDMPKEREKDFQLIVLGAGVLAIARMYRRDMLVFDDDQKTANCHQAYRILSTDETSNSQRARHSSEPAAPTSAPVGKAKRRQNSDKPRQKKVKETTHLDELAFAILNKRRNQAAAAAQVPQQAVVEVTPPAALQAPPPDLGQVCHPAVVEAVPPAALHAHPPALVQDPQRAEVEVTPPAAMQTPPPAKAQVHQPALVQVPSLATFKLYSVPDIQVSPAVDVQAPPLYATPLFDCYGPPPPSAFRMSFKEMLESDHDMPEVCFTSPDGAYSSQRQGPCHGCCQIVHQLKTRLAEVEAELKRGRLQQPLITPRPVLQPRVQESTMSHGPNLQSLQDQISNEIMHETCLAKAITKAMTFVFRPEQL